MQDLQNATNEHRLDINLTKGAGIATFLHQAIRFPPKHLGLGENMGSRHFNLSIGYATTCCSPLIKTGCLPPYNTPRVRRQISTRNIKFFIVSKIQRPTLKKLPHRAGSAHVGLRCGFFSCSAGLETFQIELKERRCTSRLFFAQSC